MKRLSLFLGFAAALVWVSPALSAFASATDSRWSYAVEKGKYQAKLASTGQVLWTVQWETRVTQLHGCPHVEIREQGEGQPFRCKDPIRWKKKMVFEAPAGRPLQVDRVEGRRWKQNEELFSSMDVRMDRGQNLIRYVDREGGKSESAVFPLSPLALPDELLFHWVRTLPYENAGSGDEAAGECLLLVSPKWRFIMDARIRGVENVSTPAGVFSCYRVDFSPRLAGPLRALAPKMALWCKADFPHPWVRYEGPAGGPGSPRAVIELVEFKTERPQT